MIVECIKDRLANFEAGPIKESLRKVNRFSEDENVGLDLGRLYTVYGIDLGFFIKGMPFYYICDEERDTYPTPRSAEFFKIVDPRISSHLQFVYTPEQQGLFLSEWGLNDLFYENLIEGEKKEEAIFAKYRKLMNEESRVLAGL